MSPTIDQWILKAEINLIQQLIDFNSKAIYKQLSTMPPRSAFHLTKHLKGFGHLPRSVLVYLDNTGKLRHLIQLKSHLIHGAKEHPILKNTHYVGRGAKRVVKFLLDPQTNLLYAETINKMKEPELRNAELKRMLSLNSPYLNSLICYAQYINSKKEAVTVTVSPWQSNGTLELILLGQEPNTIQKSRFLIQLLFGVKAMHDKGFTHFDLKPVNILLTQDMAPCISDLSGKDFTLGYEAPNLYPGTKITNPPTLAQLVKECFNHAVNHIPNAEPSFDLWSLGVLAYEIEHGKLLDSQDLNKVAAKILNPTLVKTKSLLEQFAYYVLKPVSTQRPTIDNALTYFFVLLAERNLTVVRRRSPVAESKEEYPVQSLTSQLFVENEDLFFQLPAMLQRIIIEKISNAHPDAISDLRDNAKSCIYSSLEIAETLKKGIEEVSQSETLEEVIQYLQSPPKRQHHAIIKAIQQCFISETSVDKLNKLTAILSRCGPFIKEAFLFNTKMEDKFIEDAVNRGLHNPDNNILLFNILQQVKSLPSKEQTFFRTHYFKVCSCGLTLERISELIPLLSQDMELLSSIFFADANYIETWVTELTKLQLPLSLPSMIKSTLTWTSAQKTIFLVLQWIQEDVSSTSAEKLESISCLYQYIQKNKDELYPPRHPLVDSLGAFLGRGKKIISRQEIQMEALQQAGFKYLMESKEGKLYTIYQDKLLFNQHTSRGWFNSCIKTTLREEIDKVVVKNASSH